MTAAAATGGVEAQLLRRIVELTDSSVHFIALLALSGEGAPTGDLE